MSYYRKIMNLFSATKWIFLVIAGLVGLSCVAQPQVDFSGEWKLNESKSDIREFPLCIFGGDRMRSKTMKIAAHANFITIDVASSSPDGALVTRQEKLAFDSKQNEVTYVGFQREKSFAKWSADGQAMTVSYARSLDKVRNTADFSVTETWKLVDDGKSIVIQVKSISASGENVMNLVYDKQLAADYRF